MNLTPQIVASTVCPQGSAKVDLFDGGCKGLMVEVRKSGRKTYYLRYVDARKKQRQYRIGDCRDLQLSEARKQADKLRGRIALGEDISDTRKWHQLVPTVRQLIHQHYLPFVKVHKRSWKTDESLLRNHVEPTFGDLYLDQIGKTDILTFIAQHRQTHAPGSVNRVVILLRYLFNCARRWGIPGAQDNPTADIPLLAENNKKERYLTAEEARRLYESVCQSDNKMLRYIVPMLILTGARKREVLDAKWEDFDLERRLWRIPTTKLGKPRHVPMSDGVISLLASVKKDPRSNYVFANPATHKPFTNIFWSWNTARKKAGLADVRIHDLRHSFASLLINSGRSLYEVQKLLGHTQIKTTQRYAHLAPETLLDASNAATLAVGSVMGVMPNRVVDVPLVAAHG